MEFLEGKVLPGIECLAQKEIPESSEEEETKPQASFADELKKAAGIQ